MGSEMCIRDSVYPEPPRQPARCPKPKKCCSGGQRACRKVATSRANKNRRPTRPWSRRTLLERGRARHSGACSRDHGPVERRAAAKCKKRLSMLLPSYRERRVVEGLLNEIEGLEQPQKRSSRQPQRWPNHGRADEALDHQGGEAARRQGRRGGQGRAQGGLQESGAARRRATPRAHDTRNTHPSPGARTRTRAATRRRSSPSPRPTPCS